MFYKSAKKFAERFEYDEANCLQFFISQINKKYKEENIRILNINILIETQKNVNIMIPLSLLFHIRFLLFSRASKKMIHNLVISEKITNHCIISK